MEKPQPKQRNMNHLEVTRKLNALIVNMTRTSAIIYALAGYIENDEGKVEDDATQALAFIDQQLAMINTAKESIAKLKKQPETKTKSAA